MKKVILSSLFFLLAYLLIIKCCAKKYASLAESNALDYNGGITCEDIMLYVARDSLKNNTEMSNGIAIHVKHRNLTIPNNLLMDVSVDGNAIYFGEHKPIVYGNNFKYKTNRSGRFSVRLYDTINCKLYHWYNDDLYSINQIKSVTITLWSDDYSDFENGYTMDVDLD